MRILAIGAHPDDVEIGCGGLLLNCSKLGHEIYIYILTHGEAREVLLGGKNGGKREEEAKNSAEMIGAKGLWFGEFADTKLLANGDLVNNIEEIVKRISPDLILSHSIRDEHHDHKAVGVTTLEAARYVSNILSYENILTKDFIPQAFIDISDVISDKIKLLSLFESQRNSQYLESKAIFGLAQYRAFQSRLPNVKFVEAFQVMKLKIFDNTTSILWK